MSRKKIRKEKLEEIGNLIGLLSGEESSYLDGNNGTAGFMGNETYGLYETIETIAMNMSGGGCDYMSKIAAMAVGYDKRSSFDKAREIWSNSNFEANFKVRIKKSLNAYKIALTNMEPNDAIESALSIYFKSFDDPLENMNKFSQQGDFPNKVALKIFDVIGTLFANLKWESRPKSVNNLRDKIGDIDALELSNKKSPGGAVIGTSLALIKNILMSKDTHFINQVLSELQILLR